MESDERDICKYCETPIEDLEILQCRECNRFVHKNCLKRGIVPGGLTGDVFFQFLCLDCSSNESEQYIRDKMPCKRKKKWAGTVSGTLSHHSPHFFKSGTSVFNEQGWWTLTFAMLSPNTIVHLNAELMAEKQKMKELKLVPNDAQLLKLILLKKPYATEKVVATTEALLKHTPYTRPNSIANITKNMDCINGHAEKYIAKQNYTNECRKKPALLPTIESLTNLLLKKRKAIKKSKTLTSKPKKIQKTPKVRKANNTKLTVQQVKEVITRAPYVSQFSKNKYLDPLCHYNTSFTDLDQIRGVHLQQRIMGGMRKDLILSPYTSYYLKPYIRIDTTLRPAWLQLMDELKVKVNQKNPRWKLPPRSPLCFTYVQPGHLPAVNSLCAQFFWSGIDLAETLSYPDFTCIVMYRKLIVGFAFLVPDVNLNEAYLSFIFTRPGWRNAGIAKFMLYHLIQTNVGKDITLHVSISNVALCLYQKFGFKVESVATNFYDRYMPNNTRESKNAFFCRLER